MQKRLQDSTCAVLSIEPVLRETEPTVAVAVPYSADDDTSLTRIVMSFLLPPSSLATRLARSSVFWKKNFLQDAEGVRLLMSTRIKLDHDVSASLGR